MQKIAEKWAKAVAALDELRNALTAAGLLPADGATAPPKAAGTATATDRRRESARLRQARRRERLAGVTSHAQTVTQGSSGRDASRSGRDSAEALPRAPAFLIEEKERKQPPLPAAIGPLPFPSGSGVAPSAPSPSAPPVPMGREGTALPLQATQAGGGVSDSVAPSESAPQGVDQAAAPEKIWGRDSVTATAGRDSVTGSAVAKVWEAYAAAVAPARVRLTDSRRALIARRLREYSADELCAACRGYGRSPWHRGENPNGKPYQSLELWFRDAAHIEAGQAMAAASPRPAAAAAGRAALSGIAAAWEAEAAAATQADAEGEGDPFAALDGWQ